MMKEFGCQTVFRLGGMASTSEEKGVQVEFKMVAVDGSRHLEVGI